MEELEQASSLVALGEEAQEVLRKVCEEQGINQEAFQTAVNNLAALCAYTVEQIANAFAALKDSLAEVVTPAVRALSEQLSSIFPTEELFFMVPPHIRHLAYNHPKARVRNKNWNRMWKIRERYMKWHKD
jgi:hypothetical protein